jgi:hypothetical protein
MGLKANADGSGAIQVGGSDAITISAALNTTFAGTAAVPTGTLYPLVAGTAVASTSGTSIDFTSIPSWVKRINVMFQGVSTSGTSNIQIQIGSGSVTTTGYVGAGALVASSSASSANLTTGFAISLSVSAANTYQGIGTICLIGSNTWVYSGVYGRGDTTVTYYAGGVSPALGGVLDRIRITTVNGTDTFDAGSINILYE